VQVGQDHAAAVTRVGWTAVEVRLENGWTAALHSRDVGLAPWAEIGGSLHEGDRVCVRVEALDATMRSIHLSLQQGPRSAD
jgi:ribosomal protein S1